MSNRTKRDDIKRQLGHTLRNLKLAEQHLATVWQLFSEVHPEHAAMLDTILSMVYMAETLLTDFSKASYGYVPEDLQAWRDVPNPD